LSERALSDKLSKARPDELRDLRLRLAEVEGRTTVGRHTEASLEALNAQADAIRKRIKRLEGSRARWA
jgi:uncharacterized protein YPO0396